jgi:hypothetical protein
VSGVARCGLDDRAARLEQACAFRGLEHRQTDPVLDGATGVEHLELCQEQRLAVRRAEIPGHPADPDQRRPADQVEDRFGVLHRGRV